MKQEIECNCVAALLKYGDLYPEIVHFINENDFDSNLNKTIFVFLKKNLMKGEENDIYSLNSSILSSKINFREYDGELMDYLNAIQMRPITKAAGLKAFKILKRLSVKKLCINSLKEAARNIKCLDNDQPLIKILETLDKTIYNQRFIFDNQDEFVNLTKDIEYILEDRRKNNKEETGFMLPTFPKVNELYGSLLRPGNITIIGARTGVGKTSLGLFTLSQVVAQYGVPMLHLDTGEMTEDEIRDRLVVMLTEGQIPLYDIETGKFGRNKDYINIIRKSTNGVAKNFPYSIKMWVCLPRKK
ncbi:MAG: hypothetical protein HC836_24270 [Richelia sp. RM2_1_2]|nr:hypothetical protein [Richelia sp. RM2_1_2]